MKTKEYFLITLLSYTGKKVNFAITTDREKAKSICKDYKSKEANYKRISDYKAIDILLSDFGCIKAF